MRVRMWEEERKREVREEDREERQSLKRVVD
jgi:hypothetical protein